jgi:hypothetical protein
MNSHFSQWGEIYHTSASVKATYPAELSASPTLPPGPFDARQIALHTPGQWAERIVAVQSVTAAGAAHFGQSGYDADLLYLAAEPTWPGRARDPVISTRERQSGLTFWGIVARRRCFDTEPPRMLARECARRADTGPRALPLSGTALFRTCVATQC